jgi:uncharacterized protein (TIGR02647 family)
MLTTDLLEEINVLALFSLESIQEGLKVHTTAEPDVRSATERLFKKGLITQIDGGYLTPLGHEAAEHLRMGAMILKSA